HRALDARAALEGLKRPLHDRRLRKLAHSDRSDLGGRHTQRHLVFDEVNDEQLELAASNLLFLDGDDLPYPVGWIHDDLVVLEALTLVLFFSGLSLCNSLTARPATAVRLCHGSSPAGWPA